MEEESRIPSCMTRYNYSMYTVHATPAQIQKREACDKFPEDQGYRIPETGETAIIQCKETGPVSISWVANRGATE